jgi:hypothetical protein
MNKLKFFHWLILALCILINLLAFDFGVFLANLKFESERRAYYLALNEEYFGLDSEPKKSTVLLTSIIHELTRFYEINNE